jgi:hypothetical protein
MKTNYSKQLVTPNMKTLEDSHKAIQFLYGHIQSLTDSLEQVVNGGLSLSVRDQNLPIATLRARLSSGNPTVIPAYGAAIIYVSDNAIVDRFAYRTVGQKSLEVTVLFDDNGIHDIVFLVVNERLP